MYRQYPQNSDDTLAPSRRRVANRWRLRARRYLRNFKNFVRFGPGAVAAAGVANLFAEVPDLDTAPPVNMRNPFERDYKKARVDGGKSSGGFRGQPSLKDQAGYTQRSQIRRKTGRKISRRALASKILNSSISSLVTRFQNLSNAEILPFPLNYQSAATDGSSSVYPFYLFDLTSVPNRTGPSTDTWTYPAVCYRLTRGRTDTGGTDINNRYLWRLGNPGWTPNGSSTYTWLCERKPSRVGPIARGHIDWVDIRLGFRGPKAKPCNAYAALVQINEKFTPPLWGFSNTDGAVITTPTQLEGDVSGVSDDVARAWNEFYMGLVDGSVSHPLNKRDAYNVKGMKVLNIAKIPFNPTASYETDTFGHKIELKWFKNFHRTVNYQWEKTDPIQNATDPACGVTVTTENDANRWDTANYKFTTSATDNVQAWPHPNARIFLMVWAESTTNSAYSENNHASFELLLRRKHSVLTNL